MSGFEVAGIVLAAFPLAISALNKYREVATRLGLFYKIQLEHKKWLDDLEFHQLLFSRHLRQLVLPLVVDDDKIKELLSNPRGDGWRDRNIAAALASRLGDSYELYFKYVSGVKGVVDDINHELAVDQKPVQEKLNHLRAKCGASKAIPHTFKDKMVYQLYRLKFSNSEATRKRLFEELQAYNDKLDKLLDSSDEDARLTLKRAVGMQLNAIERATCTSWIQAGILFKALAAAWRCRCQRHEAKLLLEHRTSEKLEFHVVFTNLASSQWEIQKTRISRDDDAVPAMMKENARAPEPTTIFTPRQPSHRQDRPIKSAFRHKQSSAVTTRTEHIRSPPSVTVMALTADPEPSSMTQQISNLCASLKSPKSSCCGYLSVDDCKYYVYTVSRRTANVVPSISLDQILRREVQPVPKRSQRYALSLSIASSFIQLLDSPWLPSASIRKADIHFLGDLDNPNIFLIDQPHINPDFTLTRPEAPAAAKPTSPISVTEALDHLGIMLLELCFGQALQDQPYRGRWPAGSDERERACFDIMAARDWQREVNDEAGQDFAEAVAWCLGGNRSTPPDKWRQEMLKRVIKPLQRCLDYLKLGSDDVAI